MMAPKSAKQKGMKAMKAPIRKAMKAMKSKFQKSPTKVNEKTYRKLQMILNAWVQREKKGVTECAGASDLRKKCQGLKSREERFEFMKLNAVPKKLNKKPFKASRFNQADAVEHAPLTLDTVKTLGLNLH
jgi:hypothetical protein